MQRVGVGVLGAASLGGCTCATMGRKGHHDRYDGSVVLNGNTLAMAVGDPRGLGKRQFLNHFMAQKEREEWRQAMARQNKHAGPMREHAGPMREHEDVDNDDLYDGDELEQYLIRAWEGQALLRREPLLAALLLRRPLLAADARNLDFDVHQRSINRLVAGAMAALRAYKPMRVEALIELGRPSGSDAQVLLKFREHLSARSVTSEIEVFERVVSKIITDFGHSRLEVANLTEILASQVRSAVTQWTPVITTVCRHGRLTRVLSTFDGVDPNWKVGVTNTLADDEVVALAVRVRAAGGSREDFLREARASAIHAGMAAHKVLDMSMGFDED